LSVSFLPVIRPPQSSTRFPYTTLFRSQQALRDEAELHALLRRDQRQDRSHHPDPDERDRRDHEHRERRDEVRLREVEPEERGHRSEEHTSELQSPCNLVCRLLREK